MLMNQGAWEPGSVRGGSMLVLRHSDCGVVQCSKRSVVWLWSSSIQDRLTPTRSSARPQVPHNNTPSILIPLPEPSLAVSLAVSLATYSHANSQILSLATYSHADSQILSLATYSHADSQILPSQILSPLTDSLSPHSITETLGTSLHFTDWDTSQ